MGIPFYFKYLFDNFPNTIHHIHDKLEEISIDNYLIDLNFLIHNVCQKFFPKKENRFDKPKRLLHPKKEEKINISNKMIYSEVCKKIEERVFIIHPRKRIFLSIDGVAGCSKGSQQRQRRFLSIKSKNIEEINQFDSNCISAGTEFMDGLSKYLDIYFKNKINSSYKSIEIIFSNEKVVGEGEHKLIIYIRKNFQQLLNNKETICIDSPDADLLMLALGTHYPYMYVFRNNIYEFIKCKYFLVDISQLRINMLQVIKQNDPPGREDQKRDDIKKENKEEDDKLIDDFLLIGTWFGNDFVHIIHSLEMNTKNMDELLMLYFQNRKLFATGREDEKLIKENIAASREGLNIIIKHNNKYCFNIKFLKSYLYLISKKEIELFKNKSKFIFTDKLLQKFTNEHNVIDFESYRKEYYKTKLYITTQEEKNQFCYQYLKTLIFVIRYYLSGIPDHHFSFQYHYSPFFTDLYEYVCTLRDKDILDFDFNENNKPLSLYEQLISILPIESKHLLPKIFHPLYEVDSEIYDFYPINFDTDIDGVREEYQGKVLLNFVDVQRLKDAYNKIDQSYLTEFEKKRNKIGKVMIYTNENGVVNRKLINN